MSSAQIRVFEKHGSLKLSGNSDLTPSDKEEIIAHALTEYDRYLSFRRERLFIFKNRGGDQLFSKYCPLSGNPHITKVAYMCFCPAGAEADFDGGPLPGPGTLQVQPLGSKIYGMEFNTITGEVAHDSVKSVIDAAIEIVKGGEKAGRDGA